MTDVAPETTADPPAEEAKPDTGVDLTSEVEKWKSLARKHEEKAKANADAAKELEKVRQQSMTETEKAVSEAFAKGRSEGLSEGGAKVARAEVRAAAAGRLDADQVATLLDGLNLAAFLGDDGEVDQAKVAAFIDGIAPKPDPDKPAAFPDLGQGVRGSEVPLGSDALGRILQKQLGIR